MQFCTGAARLGNPRCLQSDPILYLCSICRHRNAHQYIAQVQAIRTAASQPAFTERLRRKIWGPDNSPGLEDPYGQLGYLERRRLRRQQEDEARTLPPVRHEAIPEPKSGVPGIGSYDKRDERRAPRWSVPEHDLEVNEVGSGPAETWDGLEHVGETGHWSEKAPTPQESFRSFFALYEPATTPEEVLSALHQAVVEVLTLGVHSPLLNRLGHVSYTPELILSISTTSIRAESSGSLIQLQYRSGAQQSIISFINQKLCAPPNLSSSEHAATGQTVEAGDQNVSEQVQPRRPTSYTVPSLDFLSLPLGSLPLRFAVIKRLSQLTGRLIPDQVLTASTELRPIHDYILRASSPKPAKLADQLLLEQNLVNLPNVDIRSRRQTPVDRDKRLGRWKIIEAELRSKGLPTLSKSGI